MHFWQFGFGVLLHKFCLFSDGKVYFFFFIYRCFIQKLLFLGAVRKTSQESSSLLSADFGCLQF